MSYVKTSNRIKWDYTECDLVAKETAHILQKEPYLKLVTAVGQGQKVLPAERRRSIVNSSTVPVLVKKLVEQYKALKQEVEDPSKLFTPVPETVLRIEVPVVPSSESVMDSMPTELLIATALCRLFSWVDGVAKAYLAVNNKPAYKDAAAKTPRYPELSVPTKTEKIKIAVIGLFRDQFERVQEKMINGVAGAIELVWLDKDMSKTNIPPSVDHCIVTKHVGHHWFNAAQAAVPGRVHWAEAESSVIKEIHDIYSRIKK